MPSALQACITDGVSLQDTKTSDLLKPLSAVGSNTQEVPGFVVPYTWGARPRKKNEVALPQ